LRDEIAAANAAWPDSSCNNALRTALEDIEDRVKEEMEKLPLRPDEPAVRRVLAHEAGRLRQAL